MQERARRRDDFVMVMSAYHEVLVGPMRRGHEETVEGFIEDTGTELVPIDRSLAKRAARLRADHRSLRLGDALVLAVAVERGAELLTFDDRLSRLAAQ